MISTRLLTTIVRLRTVIHLTPRLTTGKQKGQSAYNQRARRTLLCTKSGQRVPNDPGTYMYMESLPRYIFTDTLTWSRRRHAARRSVHMKARGKAFSGKGGTPESRSWDKKARQKGFQSTRRQPRKKGVHTRLLHTLPGLRANNGRLNHAAGSLT